LSSNTVDSSNYIDYFNNFNYNEKNGLSDVTDKLNVIFSKGGVIYVPKGKYLIGYNGDDAGGVFIGSLKVNIRVICHYEAVFIADNLDNDMIRFWNVPSNLNIEWYGGIFYQYNQKTSQVVPFSSNYPSKNKGISNTCDALVVYSTVGTNNCIIDGIQCYAVNNAGKTDEELHWIDSGGDGGLFIDGMQNLIVRNCKFVGNRDCGIYTSKANNSILIENNRIINCFHGITGKRGVTNITIRNNYIENCVRGIAIQYISPYNDASNVTIQNNVENKCNVFIQVQKANTFNINNNACSSLGSTFPNGSIIPEPGVAVGIDIDNSINGNIKNNTVNGLTNGILSSSLKNTIGLYRTINGSVNNTFENNTITY
jgi:parallel beta-helix repeat protein